MPDFLMMPKSKVAAEIITFVREALSPSDVAHAGVHQQNALARIEIAELEVAHPSTRAAAKTSRSGHRVSRGPVVETRVLVQTEMVKDRLPLTRILLFLVEVPRIALTLRQGCRGSKDPGRVRGKTVIDQAINGSARLQDHGAFSRLWLPPS